jgi:hypothetical protein
MRNRPPAAVTAVVTTVPGGVCRTALTRRLRTAPPSAAESVTARTAPVRVTGRRS